MNLSAELDLIYSLSKREIEKSHAGGAWLLAVNDEEVIGCAVFGWMPDQILEVVRLVASTGVWFKALGASSLALTTDAYLRTTDSGLALREDPTAQSAIYELLVTGEDTRCKVTRYGINDDGSVWFSDRETTDPFEIALPSALMTALTSEPPRQAGWVKESAKWLEALGVTVLIRSASAVEMLRW